jgi:hypothetical protein
MYNVCTICVAPFAITNILISYGKRHITAEEVQQLRVSDCRELLFGFFYKDSVQGVLTIRNDFPKISFHQEGSGTKETLRMFLYIIAMPTKLGTDK